jgi:hypothetical protein
MVNNILIQSIGFIALILFALSFQVKLKKDILYLHLLSMIFFAIHFSLLNAWTAVAMVSLNAIKSYVFSLKNRIKQLQNNFILYLFIILFWIFGLLTWEGIHSLFVIFALNFVVLSHWSDNTKKLRLLFLFSHPLWIAYDFVVGSYIGIISEIIVLISGVTGLWRYKEKNL